MSELARIIADYRSGALSAAAAARELLPLLQAAGTLDLALTEKDMPLLHALERISAPPLPEAQALTWDTALWRGLDGMPAMLWPRIVENEEHTTPQCLACTFLVSSDAAARALIDQFERAGCQVYPELPDDYTAHCGRVHGKLPARLLTEPDLVAWGAWLQSLTPVPGATLELLQLSPPRADRA